MPDFQLNAEAAQQRIEQALAGANLFRLPPIPEADKFQPSFKIFTVNQFHRQWSVDTGMGTFNLAGADPLFAWDFRPGTVEEYKSRMQSDYDAETIIVIPEGTYHRRAIKNGEIPYGRPTCIPRVAYAAKATDMRSADYVREDGINLVADILGVNAKDFSKNGPNKSASSNITSWGYFMAAGHLPTVTELAGAKQKFVKKMQELWTAAQKVHMQGPLKVDDISELDRWADVYLGRNAEWNQEARELMPCPGCGEGVFVAAAVHSKCGWVIDEVAYEKQMTLRAKMGAAGKK